MNQDQKLRIEALLDSLKSELSAEIDTKLEKAQDQMLEQTSGQIEEYIEAQVEDEVAFQIEVQEQFHHKIQNKFKYFQTRLQEYHIIYAFLVGTGFMLFWFGVWQLLAQLTFFKDGVLPLIIGLLLLFITGAVYKKLVD